MKSKLPKVLHAIGGRSLLGHVISAAQSTGPDHVVVVVRHDRDAVAAHATEIAPVIIADQDEIPGTGRATWCAMQTLPADLAGPVLVLAADVPLLDREVLAGLLQSHVDGGATILSAIVPNPFGYGRIIRDDSGAVEGIVEEKDATAAQREVREINSGVYVFDARLLREALEHVGDDNAQGEVYLTDVIRIARDADKPVHAVISDDAMVSEGVNDKAQLATLGAELNRRIVTAWMKAGVTIVDPASTWIDVTVTLEPDSTILPGVQLHGTTTIAEGASVGPDTTLTNVTVGEGASVIRTHATDSVIGPRAMVGPYAYLRQNAILDEGAKVGTFSEMKNTHLGPGAKQPHLSYLGDAVVGEGANIGAGTITANYDGIHKHHTEIGAHARVGSDTMIVPPVKIGEGAYTGAGTVVRRDVPPGALAVPASGRLPVGQNNVEGWTLNKRPGTTSAIAAERALAEDSKNTSPNPQQETPR